MKKMVLKKTYFKNCTALVCSFVILVASCKKNDDKQRSVDHKVEPVFNESQLYSIKENASNTILDIKGKGVEVVVYNSNPGHAIGNNGNRYKIVDEFGKEYSFDSATTFGAEYVTPLHGAITIFKNDKEVFKEKYDFSKFHFCTAGSSQPIVDAKGGPTTSGVGKRTSYWQNGKTLRVKFWNDVDSVKIKDKIKHYAKIWETHANIRFDFVPSTEEADIFISLEQGKGSWSYLGTESRSLTRKKQPSMNFGRLSDDLDESKFSAVVLHEFGHALGLAHEQYHTNVLDNINDRALVLYYLNQEKRKLISQKGILEKDITSDQKNDLKIKSEKATRAFLENPDLRHPSARVTDFEHSDRHDPLSIMHYLVPAEATYDGRRINYNSELSQGDIDFIKTIYPNNNQSDSKHIFDIRNDKNEITISIIKDLRDAMDGTIWVYLHRNIDISSIQNNQYYILVGGKSYTVNPISLKRDADINGYLDTGIKSGRNKDDISIEMQEPGKVRMKIFPK